MKILKTKNVYKLTAEEKKTIDAAIELLNQLEASERTENLFWETFDGPSFDVFTFDDIANALRQIKEFI